MAEFAEVDRQLPLGAEIFLDHVGHFVRDPQAASRALARAGFAPTPVSVQTQPDPAGGAPRLTGTGNVTAMLGRGYVEVLFKTADTPLGQELDAAMARYAGIHLVAFGVADAGSAHARLRQEGFRVRPLVDMQRPVETGGSARNRGLHGGAPGAGRDAGGPHPAAHPPHRADGVAAALARASQRRRWTDQRHRRGRRCRRSGPPLRASHRPPAETIFARSIHRARSRSR